MSERRHGPLSSLATVAVLLAMVTGSPRDAAAAPPTQPSGPGAQAPVTPVTPVLSARRLPGFLASSRADLRLVDALAPVLAQSTPDTCATVRSGGRLVDRVNGDRPLVPASTEKLLTATAVFERLGRNSRLTTSVVSRAAVTNGVLEGDLYVVGAGDPLLITSGYTSTFQEVGRKYNDFARLADAIRSAGVTAIRGNVVGDESRFDSQRYLPSWPASYAQTGEVGPLGALTVNNGFTGLSKTPDQPTQYRQPGKPALLAAETLISLLKTAGIQVSGGPAEAKAPAGAKVLAGIDSLTMADTVSEMLRSSDNTTAEILLKDLGAKAGGVGSTVAGAKVVQDTITTLGLPVKGSVTIDGSGLDLGNRVTCDLLVAALERQGPSSVLAGDLPVAGRTGTLRRRLRGTAAEGNVRAKTGTLDLVSSLAGFAKTPSSEELTFAVVVNGPLSAAIATTDAVAKAVAEHDPGVALDVLGPLPAGN